MMSMRTRRRTLAIATGLALTAWGCGAREPVRVEGAWVRAADSAGTSAAYLTLVNDGPDTLVVTGVSGTCAERLEVHETYREGGMAGMREVHDLVVAPRSRLAFEPGGRHVMLIGLRQRLTPGLWVQLALHVRSGADLPVVVGVRP